MGFHRDNHYVPCVYLKGFASSPGKVQTYRILVADSRVPLWKESSIRGVGYHSHLYTRLVKGADSDEIENWLNREFETPAEEALAKATTDARLLPGDWRTLVRFLAAQDVRTPARFAESLPFWHKVLPQALDDSLAAAVAKLKAAKESGQPIRPTEAPNSEYIPVGIRRELMLDQQQVNLQAEVVVGRGLWLFQIKHMLTQTVDVLLNQKWSIVSPPDGIHWFTSDDPVIKVNSQSNGQYDFKGQWGTPGTEIMLPLSARHLLCTRVGQRPPQRGSILSREQSEKIRRLIAEHAHRFIFANVIDPEMPKLRPRTIDLTMLRNEDQQWRKWQDEQTAAEQKIVRR